MSDLPTRKPADGPLTIDRIGEIHVLAIGISKYFESSGFSDLPHCANDALAIRNCFTDNPQLYADPSKVLALTSIDNAVSKGVVMSAVRKLASDAGAKERILFFYSGHGKRIGEKLYLAPQDAWAADDPDALLDFDTVLKLLDNSRARQKIAILDVAWPGPADKKSAATEVSREFLEDLLQRTEGVIVLASNTSARQSAAKSPNAKLSLFTYHLTAALAGAADALENSLLSIPKLFEYVSARVGRDSRAGGKPQEPFLHCPSSEELILGDFLPVFVANSLDLQSSPVRSILFADSENLNVKEVLPSIQKWTYSVEYLASKVNDALPSRYEEEFGETVAALKDAFNFPDDEVQVDGAGVRFPGGRYWFEYEAEDKRSGKLMKRLSLSESWFADLSGVSHLLKMLGIKPHTLELDLSIRIEQKTVVPGLRAAGWTMSSQLPDKVIFKKDTVLLTIKPRSLTFEGFTFSDLFAATETKQSQLAKSVIKLITAPTP